MKRNKKPIIKTDRLCLKSISKSDIEDGILLLTNDEIKKTYMLPDLKSREEQVKMFERFSELSVCTKHFVYGIYLDDRLIGFINDVGIQDDGIELGYVIHPEKKNNGFATEMLSAAINELFNMGYSAVTAGFFEDNIASRRVMEKCAMVQTTKTDDIEYRGKIHHCIYFEIRKNDKE